MSKFLNTSYKVIMYILMFFFLVITVVSAFYGIDQKVSPLIVILGAIVTFFLFKFINDKLNKLSSSKIKYIAIFLTIIFFIGLLLIGLLLPISSVTDLSHIIEYVNRLISENSLTITGSYFSKYPNQIPLLIFVYGFTKIGSIFGTTNVLLMGTIFNAIFMALTGYFIYLIGKDLKSPKAGLLALIFMIINPIFYLYSSYFYTDTLCMPFGVIGLYLIIKSIKTNNTISKIVLAILSGFFFFIGLKIRIVVAILLIAVCIYILINKQITSKLKIYLALLIGLVIGILGFKLAYNYFEIDLDENAAFPITHWLMMGLNEEYTGGYNASDHDITFNEPTKEEKIEKNIEEIKTRLKDLGIIGVLKLETFKTTRTWSSGNYGVYAKLNNTSDGVGIYEYLGGYGNTNIFMKYSLQILKTYISFMVLLGIYQIIKKKNAEYNFDTIIYIALFGAILFYLIWEAAQRYSLSFLPWMIIPLGIIYSKIDEKTCPNPHFKIKKYASLSLMLITFILLTIYFPKYTLEQKDYEDIRILSYRGFSEITINDDIISQTFTTKDNFNQIKVKFNNNNEEEKSKYIFRLYDEDHNILLKETLFNSQDISSNSYYKFKFADITPNKNTNYRIEISKLEGKSTLSIATFNESIYYKSYNKGTVYINNEEVSDTFIFRVDLVNKRSYISIISYLILSLSILGIEFISLKKYFISKDEGNSLRK